MGLKEARKRAGLTAKDVALSLGVTFQNVYNWENGSPPPSGCRSWPSCTAARWMNCWAAAGRTGREIALKSTIEGRDSLMSTSF